jgi:heavy metal translocating P-type ATPase
MLGNPNIHRMTTQLTIEGMTCAACASRVGRALQAVPGVTHAHVNLATERAQITGDVTLATLLEAVEESGYGAHPFTPAEDRAAARAAEQHSLGRAAALALALALPLLLLEMSGHLLPAIHHWIAQSIGLPASHMIQAVLATAILFGPGLRFFRLGLPALWRRAPDMNALVAIGAGAAWVYSMAILATTPGEAVYFESAGVIMALVLLGRWLEGRARGRTSGAIRALSRLAPRIARRADGSEVALDALALGDALLIRPGEAIPTDGIVLTGNSFLDQSMFTGEPMPVARGPGDAVLGGSVNQSGALTIRVDKLGGDTLLAGVIRMVEEAQNAQMPIQALVDRITLWFVPAVMAVAALTFALWLAFGPSLAVALTHAVAVLIIACPCAMGLATPTSIMVGMGRAASLGVLFRHGDALQRLADVQGIAFDKTGTLTEGHPALIDTRPAPGFTPEALLRLAAAVEAHSEHPIARAILAAHPNPPPALGFLATSGEGAAAEVEGQTIRLGSAAYLRAAGIPPDALEPMAAEAASQGQTPVFIAVADRAAGLLLVADRLRPSTPEAIALLRRLGLRLMILSGDHPAAVAAMARSLGIEEAKGGLLPADKVAALAAAPGFAFTGDGINDAPALAAASVGIAIGTGTDIAIDSADIVLMGNDLKIVAQAITLSRATLTNIRQNLAWAFAYNAALIPVAAGALQLLGGPGLSPMLAAGAMGFSSLFVLGNALRLRGVKL